MTDFNCARKEVRGPEEDTGVETGFFEVSKLVESPEALRGWVNWFEHLNIPCFIEKRRSSKYVLWRKGMEVGGKGCKPTIHAKNIVYRSGL